jgi:hypothetical protein
MLGAPFQKNAGAVKAFHVSWDRFSSRCAGARLALSAWRSQEVAWCRPPSSRANSTCGSSRQAVSRAMLRRIIQREMKILKNVLPETARGGEGLLVVDDLADTGATVKNRSRDLAQGACRNGLCQAAGAALRRYLHYRGFAVHLDLFPVGPRLEFSGADRRVWPRLINADLVLPRAALNGACLLLLTPLKPMAASGRAKLVDERDLKLSMSTFKFSK